MIWMSHQCSIHLQENENSVCQIHSIETMSKLISGITIHNIYNYNKKVIYIFVKYSLHYSLSYTQQQNELEHTKRPWCKGQYNVFTMTDDKTYHANDLPILHNRGLLQIENISLVTFINSVICQNHNVFLKHEKINISKITFNLYSVS